MEPLSLKYRPRTFGDIVGQKPTRAVLAKIVESGTLPPSMIFAGVRGTGKTSAARIVAKAINCERLERFEPCNECAHCLAVDNNTATFVLEMDAASHGSAEAMRKLVEDAMYSAGSDWKVFVLDEVHSVSKQGFQVLLKTLEEPPPRTSFILVTTEPDKIPETIHARSMFFRFTKLRDIDIYRRLKYISTYEQTMAGSTVHDEALRWIAEQSDGGMRDAIMMMDQVNRLGMGVTLPVLQGLFGEQSTGRWIKALLSGNPAKAVLVADELVSAHGSVGAFIDKTILTLREVVLAKDGQREMPVEMGDVQLTLHQAIELIKKLWKMRDQVKRLGPDDRAAVVALSAELSRKPVQRDTLTAAQLEEAIG